MSESRSVPKLIKRAVPYVAFASCVAAWFQTQVAIADAAVAAEAQALSPVSDVIKGDGNPISNAAFNFKITPPIGWEVTSNTGSLTLVMKEPRVEAPDYEKPKYQRNITLAIMHKGSPIDEAKALDITKQLADTFGKDSSLSDFKVTEHKLFNYKGQNDGLVVYSAYRMGDFELAQMHVLVSGKEKQYMMTYTDLADRFQGADGAFEKAWNSMVSIEVDGVAPSRFDEVKPYVITGSIVGMMFLSLAVFAWRRSKTDYRSVNLDDSDDFMSAPPLSLHDEEAHTAKKRRRKESAPPSSFVSSF